MIHRLLISVILVMLMAPPSQAAMSDYPIVKLQALDKSTARTVTFEAKVGSTIEYGSLFIKIQSCRKSDPLDKPESAAFLQIWEVPLNAEKSEWVFSGWMFASSPALSAMDHAVYDVWVLDCLDKAKKKSAAKKAEIKEETVDQKELDVPQDTAEETDTPATGEEEAVEEVIDSEAEGAAPEDSGDLDTPAEEQETGTSFDEMIERTQNSE